MLPNPNLGLDIGQISSDNDSVPSSNGLTSGGQPHNNAHEPSQQQNEIPPPETWYTYKKLVGFRTTRFIKLQPKRSISPHNVHIQLFQASLEDEISYYALSYAWG